MNTAIQAIQEVLGGKELFINIIIFNLEFWI